METRARFIVVGLFAVTAILAGFGFVYWLNNSSGLSRRETFRVRFDGPVSGLQKGAAVRFNGIRVGEVTGLRLDLADPSHVTATIAVDAGTPIHADTMIGVDYQGLLGTPAIALRGGSAAAPRPRGAAVLEAEPGAGQDLAQTARLALQQVNKILGENSASLKATMDNLKTFTDALARNSGKVDGVLAGLERLAGNPADKHKAIYDLTVPKNFPTVPSLKGDLGVGLPTAVVTLDSQLMLTRTEKGEIASIENAMWSDTLPKLIQARIVEGFEGAGFADQVSAQDDKAAGMNRLQIELRRFDIALTASPTAEVVFLARILGEDGRTLKTQLFHVSTPARGKDAASVAASLDAAFGKALIDLVGWVATRA